jgi:hypothetical protein
MPAGPRTDAMWKERRNARPAARQYSLHGATSSAVGDNLHQAHSLGTCVAAAHCAGAWRFGLSGADALTGHACQARFC